MASLKSIRIKNFKAIKDSGTIKLSPLTVFIGNNGSGKSSVIEALRTMQDIVDEGLDQTMHNWHGFEHIWHKGAGQGKVSRSTDRPSQSDPMSIEVKGKGRGDFKTFMARSTMSLGESGDELFFVDELLKTSVWEFTRDRTGQTKGKHKDLPDGADLGDLVKMLPLYVRNDGGTAAISVSQNLPDDESLLEGTLEWFISEWQYLAMDPQLMGLQVPQQRTGGRVSLNRDGSNIAEYLLSIREQDAAAFQGIVSS